MNVKDLIPIPDIRQARNALVIFPHPDDAELVCGGTVALLIDAGATVTYAPVTGGQMGTFDPSLSRDQVTSMRRSEQLEAAKVLGVKHVEFLGFQDGFLPETGVLRRSMVGLIRKVRPDFLITLDPWLPYEAHPDHRKSAMAAVEAAMYAAFHLAYPEDLAAGQEPWSISGIALALSPRPNTIINIDTAWERKIRACLCHRSQFPPQAWNTLYFPYIKAKSEELGKEIGAAYAESFKVLHPYHLHAMVDTWWI